MAAGLAAALLVQRPPHDPDPHPGIIRAAPFAAEALAGIPQRRGGREHPPKLVRLRYRGPVAAPAPCLQLIVQVDQRPRGHGRRAHSPAVVALMASGEGRSAGEAASAASRRPPPGCDPAPSLAASRPTRRLRKRWVSMRANSRRDRSSSAGLRESSRPDDSTENQAARVIFVLFLFPLGRARPSNVGFRVRR